MSVSLRVQSTQMWGIYGFYTRNRDANFGNVLCIWVLGPLGLDRVYQFPGLLLGNFI